MKAFFDLLVLPLFMVVLLLNFHWLVDSFVLEIQNEKQLLNQSRTAEDLATQVLLDNCSAYTHNLRSVPATAGDYFVVRAAVIEGVPRLLAIGNDKG